MWFLRTLWIKVQFRFKRVRVKRDLPVAALKTASQSLLCYSARLIQNSLDSKEFFSVLLFRIKQGVSVCLVGTSRKFSKRTTAEDLTSKGFSPKERPLKKYPLSFNASSLFL